MPPGLSKCTWKNIHFFTVILCIGLMFEFPITATASAEIVPFYQKSVRESKSSIVVFPSNDYKVCRGDAAADLEKIFFCTKREWLRASTELLSKANSLSSSVEERKQIVFSLRDRLSGLAPDYLLFSAALATDDISSDQLQISNVVIINASRANGIVGGLYYNSTIPFNWGEFERTEAMIRESIEALQIIHDSLEVRLEEIDRSTKILARLTSLNSIRIPLAPRKGFSRKALSLFSTAEGSLKIDVTDFLRFENVNLWSGFDLTVSASAPATIQLLFAFGKGSSVEYFRVNYDTSVSNRFTPFTRSQARALEAHQTLNFTAIHSGVMRFLNSGRWDGTVKVWLSEPMKEAEIRQIGFRFKYFE